MKFISTKHIGKWQQNDIHSNHWYQNTASESIWQNNKWPYRLHCFEVSGKFWLHVWNLLNTCDTKNINTQIQISKTLFSLNDDEFSHITMKENKVTGISTGTDEERIEQFRIQSNNTLVIHMLTISCQTALRWMSKSLVSEHRLR